MKIALYIIGGLFGFYLLLVIPAGLGVLISEIRFRNSPYKATILQIIERYKREIMSYDRKKLDELCEANRGDVLSQNGINFSVVIGAKKRGTIYKAVVSVGVLRIVTFGHDEKFEVVPPV